MSSVGEMGWAGGVRKADWSAELGGGGRNPVKIKAIEWPRGAFFASCSEDCTGCFKARAK